jgi:hypothetical protein
MNNPKPGDLLIPVDGGEPAIVLEIRVNRRHKSIYGKKPGMWQKKSLRRVEYLIFQNGRQSWIPDILLKARYDLAKVEENEESEED